MVEEDPYEVLGVTRDSSDAQIRSAFQKYVRKFHPDLFTDPEKKKEMEKKFVVIFVVFFLF